MDYQDFYAKLFLPLVETLGPIDAEMRFPIIGFDLGGPLKFNTIGANLDGPFVTYISCELAVREDQIPNVVGRYELLCSCDDERWVSKILSELGRMSLQTEMAHGHSIDIGSLVGSDAPLQGVLLDVECGLPFDHGHFSVLRVIGITLEEMAFKHEKGFRALREVLISHGVYPHTITNRKSVA